MPTLNVNYPASTQKPVRYIDVFHTDGTGTPGTLTKTHDLGSERTVNGSAAVSLTAAQTPNGRRLALKVRNQFGSGPLSSVYQIGGTAATAPTSLSLSNSSIAENQTGQVGTLSANGTAPHTFTIVGGADSERFSIANGDVLAVDQAFDYETQTTAQVQVRAANSAGNVTQTFTITITDVSEGGTLTDGWQNVDGTLVYAVEAEGYSAIHVGGAGPGFGQVAETGAGGGQSMAESVPGPAGADRGGLWFDVVVPAAVAGQPLYIDVLMKPLDATSNTVLLDATLASENTTYTPDLSTSGFRDLIVRTVTGSYTWQKQNTRSDGTPYLPLPLLAEAGGDYDGTAVTPLNVPAGTYRIQIREREGGSRIDRVIVTNNRDFAPQNYNGGLGPNPVQ